MAVDLGSDFACVEDLDFNLSTVSGRLGVAHAVARRLQTPRGGLFYDADYGTDLRQYLNGAVANPSAIGAAVEAEAAKDERVERAVATIAVGGVPQTLTVDVDLETSEGPFELVLSVSALTVELISFDQT